MAALALHGWLESGAVAGAATERERSMAHEHTRGPTTRSSVAQVSMLPEGSNTKLAGWRGEEWTAPSSCISAASDGSAAHRSSHLTSNNLNLNQFSSRISANGFAS